MSADQLDKKRNIQLFLLFLLWFFTAVSLSNEIYQASIDSCICTLESEERWKTLTIRIFHPKAKTCLISKEDLIDFLDQAFTKLAGMEMEIEYNSIFIGRIIEYPWMSQFLADSAVMNPVWLKQKGKYNITTHRLVESILNCNYITAPFNKPLHIIGYKIIHYCGSKCNLFSILKKLSKKML